jgi:hypothetical protein
VEDAEAGMGCLLIRLTMNTSKLCRNLRARIWIHIGVVYVVGALCGTTGQAQGPKPPSASSSHVVATSDLPDAPGAEDTHRAPVGHGPSGQIAPADSGEGQQTKRILWIVPNFRAVSAGTKLPKQSVRDKFETAALDSFAYSSFVFAGIQAGASQATDAYPEFHQDAAGFGRYYWHTFGDQADENLWVEGILPSVLHQDSRYYTLGHGGFLKQSIYSVTRIVITRTASSDSDGVYYLIQELSPSTDSQRAAKAQALGILFDLGTNPLAKCLSSRAPQLPRHFYW